MTYEKKFLIQDLLLEDEDAFLEKKAEQVEEELLLAESVSDEIFNFIVEIFSSDKFSNKKSLIFFVRVIFVDFYKFSTFQTQWLIDLLVSRHKFYLDSDVLFAVADFIARKYPPAVGLSVFSAAGQKDGEISKQFAVNGLDVLRINRDVDMKIRSEAVLLQEKILQEFNGEGGGA